MTTKTENRLTDSDRAAIKTRQAETVAGWGQHRASYSDVGPLERVGYHAIGCAGVVRMSQLCAERDQDHKWGPVEHAFFSGNPHRKCTEPGCRFVTLDLDDGESDLAYEVWRDYPDFKSDDLDAFGVFFKGAWQGIKADFQEAT